MGPARTCAVNGTDCVVCPGTTGSPFCPGDACAFDRARVSQIQTLNCSTPPDLGTWSCLGSFARLQNGTICSIQAVTTAPERWSISCGFCVTVVTL
jgi:hypothetical protein